LSAVLDKKERYLQGKYSATDAVKNSLKTIREKGNLNAFITVLEGEALQQAKELDKRRASGKPMGKLAGIILAAKDNICLKGFPTTCGSKGLENFISPYNATTVQKILDEDGIIIGKTNLDEFAMGSSSENSYFGAVKNPIDTLTVPGGSSGGSAVAVKAEMVDLALGSDTGGSVRQPASFCGIVGLKPSYGRISRYGLVAYASSLDQIGIFGKSVADVSYLTGIVSGKDDNDSTSLPNPGPDYQQLINNGEKGIKIGIPGEYFQEGLDNEIKHTIDSIIEQLRETGFNVSEVSLPLTEYAIATYYIIATAEASSNLARYDGVRYGHRTAKSENLRKMYINSRSEGFGMEVKRRIMLGTYVLSSGYYDAYYKKAQQVRRQIKEQFDDVFKRIDVLITPTSPTPAFKIGEKIDDPLQMYLSDIYTVTANLTGICAINIPCGASKTGLPFGLQIMANAFREDLLFSLGSQIEKIT
jgi:aspartyl-tRNA(Asn)/glutamyl-tRNA(Gln) amidotransferase subunit A